MAYPSVSKRLCFEITETAAIADLDLAKKFADNVLQFGASLALDDFGSGFSTIKILDTLPIEYIKIDGSIVSRAVDHDLERLTLKTIVDAGRITGKKVIAEHVETPETLSLLREIGVDFAQGYLLGKRLPLSALVPQRSTTSARHQRCGPKQLVTDKSIAQTV